MLRLLTYAAAVFALALVLAGPRSLAQSQPPPATHRLAFPAIAADGAGPRSVTVAAVGDVSLARELVTRMESEGAGYPFALVRGLLAADLAVANLEGALTEGGEPWPKGYTFRTPPRFAAGLRDAGFELVSLANNHTMDYGAAGLLDTLDALDAAGVRWAGAGRDEREARTPVVLTVANGLRVAFVALAKTPGEPGFSIDQWNAGPATPGIAVAGTPAEIAAAVREARALADFVVVIMHAGIEYHPTAISNAQQTIVDAAIGAGADAVIGHHAHVVQPIASSGGRLVAFGLGNFVFDLDEADLANIPEPRVSLVLVLTLTEGRGVTGYDVRPVVLDAATDRPRPATAEEAAVLEDYLCGRATHPALRDQRPPPVDRCE